MEPQETIFLKGRDITDPAERAAYLTQACGNDADLRQRVEVMLRDAAEADAFFGPEPTGAAVAEGPGTIIGRYKLLQKIGEGGMGVVYMAEQREPVIRKVALKIIKLGMDTRQVVARFEAERQALALMGHPNIAKVLDGGATESGRPYFVMELVPGLPITQFCDEANLPTRERLELFLEVCSAVQHAHQKGIIHRDLKPSNILVTLHGDKPVPKVIDFGVAKATAGRLTEKTLFTQFQQFIGTPAYMSPEQASLSGLDIDTRSDIYGLGVLLYELLTGRTPFDGKELLKAGLDEMRRTIQETEPPQPSNRLSTLQGEDLTLTALRRGTDPPKLVHLVRGDLDWIVMKALEKDRVRRYETANGLAMDIERHLADEPIVARPPSGAYRFQKLVRRNKLAFVAAAIVSAVLVAATSISVWQAVRAKREARRAVRAESLSEQRLADSEAVSKFLTEVFQSPDPARDGRVITVAETLSNATKKLETELTNQPTRRAKLQSALGATYYALGLFPEAIALQEQIRDYYVATFGLDDPNTLAAMNSLAMSYRVAGRLDEAIKLSVETLTLRRKLLGPENTNTLATMNNLANSYQDVGRLDDALKLREQVFSLCRKLLGPEHPRTLSAMANLAMSYGDVGRLDEALKMREQVLSLCRKLLGPEHPDTVLAMLALANSYLDAGRKDEALKLREETLTLSRKVFGPEHPKTLTAMNNLANSYLDANRKDEALKLMEETLRLSRKLLGPEHPSTLGAMVNLADSYAAAGRKDEALKLGQETLSLYQKVLGPEHPDALMAMSCLAYFYDEAGRKAEALKLREKTLSLYQKVLGPEHPSTLMAMSYLAYSYDEAGRKAEALKLREEALELRRKALGPEHPDTLQAMEDLGDSYDETGRRDQWVKLREDVLALSRKVLGPENPATLNRVNNLTDAYNRTGHRAEALKLQEEVVTLSRKMHGDENPDTLGLMNQLADSYADAGRHGEALKLREEVVALRRKALGPENPDTIGTMNNLADSYADAGRRDEALKLREEVVALRRKVLGAQHPDTLASMHNLADSYLSAGLSKEAFSLLEQEERSNPTDTVASLTLAAWQAWFGQDADYEATRRRLIQQAEGTDTAETADRAAKAYCLRPSTNMDLLTNALSLAQRAVKLGTTNSNLPWFQLALGLTEYRNGLYPAAERSLTVAEQTASSEQHNILGTARFFRAMSLFRQQKPVETQMLFTQAVAQMPLLPKDESQPLLDGKLAPYDVLISWLAYKEAKALIVSQSASAAEPPLQK